MRKFRDETQKIAGKMQRYCEKNSREIINYYILKFLMMSSKSREFDKFFAELCAAALVFTEFNFSQNYWKNNAREECFCEILHCF